MATNGIDYGNTPTGFKPKRLADIIADLKSRHEQIIDPVSGEQLQIDQNDGSVISQQIGIQAEILSLCWQAAAAASLQFDPLANTGAGQSGTVQLNGILRRPGYPTVITLTLTGTAGTVIPQNSIVATPNKAYQFEISESVTIPVGGSVSVNANCTINGPVSVSNGTVTSILTPVNGWASVTNTATVTTGSLEETDAELRERQQTATATTSYCQIEAIYAAIRNVEGVTYVRIFQNNTNVVDARTIDAKSMAAVVLGGEDADIAEAIFEKAPLGIGFTGGTSVTIKDSQGTDYVVKFVRPTPVPIYIKIKVKSTDLTFPSTFEADIKAAILAYVNGGASAIGIPASFDRDGFPPGDSVILTQLYTPINSVPGLSVTSLQIDTVAITELPPISTADLTIEWNEVATFAAENITVTQVS